MSTAYICKIPRLEVSGKKILGDISFQLERSQVGVIIGKNGAGKTTLLKSMLDGKASELSEFILEEKDLSKCSVVERAKYISHLGSSGFSKPEVSAIQFLAICEGICGTVQTGTSDRDTYREVLSFWKIEHLGDTRVSKLSQGEFQRLLLGAVFRQQASLYLLDEPETHLDPEGMCLLKEMCLKKKEQGNIVLLATHDVGFAVTLADQVLGLDMSGNQMFFTDTESCIREGYLDTLYGVSCTVYRDENGNPQGVSVKRK